MRIAQLTLDGYKNYGQVLQKYALHRVLKNMADFVEVLWHQKMKNFLPYKLEMERSLVQNAREVSFESVRQSKIKEFINANIRTRFDLPYLDELADEYDFFVVGSDQVWNPEKYFSCRFLEFASPEKRIAYAASFAVDKLPSDITNYYREKISEMPHVSLREKEGVDLVEKLTGKRPLQVLDPVFLLTADEWRKIAKRPLWLDKKIYERGYVLTYFFNGKPPKQIKDFAEKIGLPTINLLDLNNFEHYATGIEEFLYLMDHATLICTQSFHGTAFATIFKRPFILNRTVKVSFSRIKSLLELFDLSERTSEPYIKIKIDDPLKIDFTRCDEVLPTERVKAFRFLAEALSRKS